MNDIQSLDSEFQEQVDKNVREVERLREASGHWESERDALLAECAQARDLVEKLSQEHEKAVADADEAASIALERQIATHSQRVGAEMSARWEADRATLLSERNRAQQRLADMAVECDALRTELDQVRHSASSAKSKQQQTAGAQAIHTEITRVEGLIQEISHVVEDPNSELSVVIRKNVERAELESYLRGLRFTLATP